MLIKRDFEVGLLQSIGAVIGISILSIEELPKAGLLLSYLPRPISSASSCSSLLRCFCSHDEMPDMVLIGIFRVAEGMRSQWMYFGFELSKFGWGCKCRAEGMRGELWCC